ncbi:type VI secretion system protein TssL, short form [Pseudomonas sp. Bout1]|uniref:type VI secretion system protein TssL, short form n=1 Tax=Pseudomonas sp. Bout1 TaxID=3048600 RepID=UPI002AB470BA|nr:type VI secretion system protein TssL, short form [Pseudomonas sp. Bout1]MDY7533456.1 type VI secretion system protein TssL, short form [Pseudomonas sp. Bout1]MEB0187868.1 type VI secretion system protein TssL, short form [Pseudomonas sp. Bout1]
MNLNVLKKPTCTAHDLDALLQDTYLLVVALRQGASLQYSPDLPERSAKQVEQLRQRLKDAGVGARSIELISYAQCALLDETALGYAKDQAHDKWASEPLQAKFFNRHQAGEFLYEDIGEALRQPAPDVLVLTAFQRVLMLGFQGRYREVNDPERQRLLAALNAQASPMQLDHALTSHGVAHRAHQLCWVRSALVHVMAASSLLAGAWWGLDYWLGGLVAMLVPVQV